MIFQRLHRWAKRCAKDFQLWERWKTEYICSQSDSSGLEDFKLNQITVRLILLLPLQVCAKGFFMSEQNVCLPCNCKGHADRCDDITGICKVSVPHWFMKLYNFHSQFSNIVGSVLPSVAILSLSELQGPQHRWFLWNVWRWLHASPQPRQTPHLQTLCLPPLHRFQ